MKTAILVTACVMSLVQSVGWIDCCCVLICKHRNEPCKDRCDEVKQKAEADCCEKKSHPVPAHHEKRCAHVQPSSEVLSQAADLHVVPPAISVELVPVVAELPAEPPHVDELFRDARGSPPLLHLEYSALLI